LSSWVSTKRLAEVVEVEVNGDGITLGRVYVNRGGAGGKNVGGEVELESGAGDLTTAVIGADEVGMAGRREGPDLFIVARDLHVEIFPEVIGTGDEAVG
jgi:hypothetical protein